MGFKSEISSISRPAKHQQVCWRKSRRQRIVDQQLEGLAMREALFDHENPTTVHDVLWSWSTGYVTAAQAMDALSLNNLTELYVSAISSDVPVPGTPSADDIKMAEDFLSAISVAG